MDDVMKLGSRIRQRRKELKWTLDEVADRVGVHKSTIHRYELGRIRDIKVPVVESIARALGVNYQWIIGESEDKESIGNQLSHKERIALAYFAMLNKDGVEAIMESAKELANQDMYLEDKG